VCIIGGGPAGLSAGLILGRCRRKVVVIDSGRPRNAASRGLHGFLTRDGIHPAKLRELGRAELARYPTVVVRDVEVMRANARPGGFRVVTADGVTVDSRILLLATGRDDRLPAQPGFVELYGRGVYHCPFCDGWEHRDQPLVAYGQGEAAFEIALELLTWSHRVSMCSDGPAQLDEAQKQRLSANGIALCEDEIAGLEADADGMLERVRFTADEPLACRALFFVSDCPQKSELPAGLGCSFEETGGVKCDEHAATNVPGLFVAGNVRCGLHFAVTAAAEGADAAVAINQKFLDDDLI
jgi:thioredoxin reductase